MTISLVKVLTVLLEVNRKTDLKGIELLKELKISLDEINKLPITLKIPMMYEAEQLTEQIIRKSVNQIKGIILLSKIGK